MVRVTVATIKKFRSYYWAYMASRCEQTRQTDKLYSGYIVRVKWRFRYNYSSLVLSYRLNTRFVWNIALMPVECTVYSYIPYKLCDWSITVFLPSCYYCFSRRFRYIYFYYSSGDSAILVICCTSPIYYFRSLCGSGSVHLCFWRLLWAIAVRGYAMCLCRHSDWRET